MEDQGSNPLQPVESQGSSDPCPKCGKVHLRCKAHKKARDEEGNMIPCNGKPMANGCCRMHNGNAARGAEHYKFKDGRFSKYMPKNLESAYQRAINDRELLDLTDHIAVLEARYAQLLEQLEKYPTPPYKRILDCLKRIEEAESNEQFQSASEELKLLCQDGVIAEMNSKRCWAQLREMSQEISNLTAKEHKRRIENKLVVPTETAVAFVTALGEAIKELVSDEGLRVSLYNRVLEFLPADDPRRKVIEGEVSDG